MGFRAWGTPRWPQEAQVPGERKKDGLGEGGAFWEVNSIWERPNAEACRTPQVVRQRELARRDLCLGQEWAPLAYKGGRRC